MARLFGKQAMHGQRWVWRRRAVPDIQHMVEFANGGNREFADVGVRRCGDRFQKQSEAPGHFLDGAPLETFGGILDVARQPIRGPVQRERQVELGSIGVDARKADGHPVQL